MRVVVLAGPPCSGKTTLARTVAQPGDVVLDYDDIARELGSPERWLHPEPWRTQTEQEMQARIATAARTSGEGTAWVIRFAARAEQRATLTRRWRAPVYLLNPGRAVCLSRVEGRPSGTRRSIGKWYHWYSPWPGDRDPSELDARWSGGLPDRGRLSVDVSMI